MADEQGSALGWKAFNAVAGMVATLAVRKVLQFGWQQATGREPPENPAHPEISFAEAAAWAVVSGVAVSLARLVAQRQAALRWRSATGAYPPGLLEQGS